MDHFRNNHRLEHSVMDPDRDHEEDEHDHVPEDEERLRGHEVGEESLGECVKLVTRADEDERGQEDVDDGVVGDQDQHPARVGAQEDVVLSDQHLYVKTTNPGEEARVSRSHEARDVAKQRKADDRQEGDIGMDLVAVQLVSETTRNERTEVILR